MKTLAQQSIVCDERDQARKGENLTARKFVQSVVPLIGRFVSRYLNHGCNNYGDVSASAFAT